MIQDSDIYLDYIALKLHFSKPSYDYKKYEGKTKTNPKTLQNRNDKYMFSKFRKLYGKEYFEALKFCFLRLDDTWIGKFITDEVYDAFKQHVGFNDSIVNTFQDDILGWEDGMCSLKYNLQSALKYHDNDVPYIIRSYLQRNTTIHTICVCNRLMNLFERWDQKKCETPNIIHEKYMFKIKKFDRLFDNLNKETLTKCRKWLKCKLIEK